MQIKVNSKRVNYFIIEFPRKKFEFLGIKFKSVLKNESGPMQLLFLLLPKKSFDFFFYSIFF